MISGASNSNLRQIILDETRHLLVSEGYVGLSMRKIAKRIGYSATTIYLYFDSKESLFHALIEEGLDRMYAALKSNSLASAEAAQRLKNLCRSYVEFGLKNPEYYEVMFVMKPLLKHRFPQDKYRRARRNLDLFVDAIRDCAAWSKSSTESAALAATQIWASLHGAVSLIVAQRIDSRINQSLMIDSMISAIVASVGAREQSDNEAMKT